MPPVINWRTRADEYFHKLRGKVRPRKHYRCGHCRARRSLKKELWEYLRPPLCNQCGRRDWRLDYSRYTEYLNGTEVFNKCKCSGYPYPHRKKSGVWCIHHPEGPSEDDWHNSMRI